MKGIDLFLSVVLIFISIGCSSSKKQEATAEEKKTQNDTMKAHIIAVPIKLSTKDLKLDIAAIKKAIEADSIYASITRTPCYGRCPIYEVKIYKSGFVTYNGKRFVERLGVHQSRLTEDQLKQIAAKAEEIGYFELKNNYDSPVTDFPTTITVLKVNGKFKKIKNRVGGPAGLKEYEKFLDELLNGLAWTKIADNQ